MPIYKDVTRSDMPKYLHAIEDMMADCSKFFSFWFLFQIVVSIVNTACVIPISN